MPTTLSEVNISNDTQLTVVLRKPVTLAGHLYDASGHPLTGQPMALTSSGSKVATFTTDATGYYSLTAAPGTYTIEISRRSADFSQNIPPSYDFYVSNFSLPQNAQQDITLPAHKVSVHVQDDLGAPVAGAQVNTSNGFNFSESLGGTSYNASGSNYYFSGQSPVTDSFGNVTLWLFASTGYNLTVTPPNGSSLTAKTLTNISISGDTQQTVTLAQPVTLSGYLYDESGHPLANQAVALQVPGNNPSATATTDASGYYSLNAQTGVYTISVSNMSAKNTDFSQNIPEGYNYYISNYPLGQSTQQNITLPARKVSVHVQDGQNSPVPGIQLTTNNGFNFNTSLSGATYNASGNDYYFSGQGPSTDTSGNATLWLFASTYDISATPPSGSIYSQFTLSNLSVGGDQNVVISLQYSHNPPQTNATLSPGPNSNGTYADPVSVTLSATAASGYSVANTYYTIDGGAQQTYANPITVTGSGDHTLTYWSEDTSGVVESAKTKVFTIHQPPAISALTKGTVNEGSAFAESGSVTSDAASLTATVDYGDGSGVQPLALFGTNFTLNHIYAEEGSYTVTVTATDNDGLTATATTTVTVNNAPFAVGAITGVPATPIALDASGSAVVNAAVAISDPGTSDTHTAVWDWGDGSAPAAATVSESNGSGSATGSHTYTAPGVYVVTITVTDDDGVSVTQVFRYASVENPYVPGSIFSAGVRYDSPAGADTANPSLTGSVKFAVQVWFKQSTGTIDPSSKVEMDFAAGNIDFVSTSVSEFISANGTGIVEGTGTINGTGTYTFLATGIDSQQSGGNTVRYKIMDASGNVVYDSQPGAPDNAAPTTPVTAGRVNVK